MGSVWCSIPSQKAVCCTCSCRVLYRLPWLNHWINHQSSTASEFEWNSKHRIPLLCSWKNFRKIPIAQQNSDWWWFGYLFVAFSSINDHSSRWSPSRTYAGDGWRKDMPASQSAGYQIRYVGSTQMLSTDGRKSIIAITDANPASRTRSGSDSTKLWWGSRFFESQSQR